jgi:pimeloyl-ACP methyl ester carboxylesterase
MAIASSLSSHFYTTSAGTKTHYLQTGDPTAKLLICLHGLGGSVETFKPLLAYLPRTQNIVLVDFQGFGKSPLTSATKPLSISGHVSDLHNLITHLQADNSGLEGEKV